MKQLQVLCCGWGQEWPLGRLADDGQHLLFEYSEEALARGIEFSPFALPLRRAAYGGFPTHQHQLPGLVSDALPDGWGLLLMDRLFLQQGRDPRGLSPLDRLAFIGNRAMGALSFVPALGMLFGPNDHSLLTLAERARAFMQAGIASSTGVSPSPIEAHATEALQSLALTGGSPHGARPKVLVQYEQATQTVSSLSTAPGTPWLFKFPAQGEHAEVCAIEQVYAQLARASGITMPASVHWPLGGRRGQELAAFGVQRFDRHASQRVPIHSFAGALHADHRLPALDYRDLLRATRFFTQDQTQVLEAYRRCVFNVVFHNRDDHAKNFALRMNERWQWQLAPAHDLTFSHGPRGQHHMAVMGEAAAPGRSHLLALAKDAGIKPAVAHRVVEQVRAQAEYLAAELGAAGVRVATTRAVVAAVGLRMVS
jgi:serine/threonine-protein kinase HipA